MITAVMATAAVHKLDENGGTFLKTRYKGDAIKMPPKVDEESTKTTLCDLEWP